SVRTPDRPACIRRPHSAGSPPADPLPRTRAAESVASGNLCRPGCGLPALLAERAGPALPDVGRAGGRVAKSFCRFASSTYTTASFTGGAWFRSGSVVAPLTRPMPARHDPKETPVTWRPLVGDKLIAAGTVVLASE